MISKYEWNKLSSNEKRRRCKDFCEFVDTGVPAGISDLQYYAEIFATPVPIINEKMEISFEGYE